MHSALLDLRPYTNHDRYPGHSTLAERLASGIDWPGNDTDCWPWRASLDAGGYGRVKVAGRGRKVHRVVYELLVGPIPDGLQIDHLCRNRACCNPTHLEPVTGRVNVLRGEGFVALNAAKTHCVNGHEFTLDNLYSWPSRPTERHCVRCRRQAVREYRARNRAQ